MANIVASPQVAGRPWIEPGDVEHGDPEHGGDRRDWWREDTIRPNESVGWRFTHATCIKHYECNDPRDPRSESKPYAVPPNLKLTEDYDVYDDVVVGSYHTHYWYTDIVCHYEQRPMCTLVVTTEPSTDRGTTLPERRVYKGFYKQTITYHVSAIPKDGSKFVKWTTWGLGDRTDASAMFRYTFDYDGVEEGYTHTREHIAHFTERGPNEWPTGGGYHWGTKPGGPGGEPVSYIDVQLFTDPSGFCTVAMSGVASGKPGEPFTFHIVYSRVQPGYEFVKWVDGSGNDIGSSDDIEITENFPDEGETLTLTYTAIGKGDGKVRLDLTVSPEGGGATIGAGEYEPGQDVAIWAIPDTDDGYAFVKWRDSAGATVSRSDAYDLVITEDTTLEALFRKMTGMPIYGRGGDLLHGSGGSLLYDG